MAAAGSAPALVIVNGACEILFATPAARAWLRKFFRPATGDGLLPQRICRWLQAAGPAGRESISAQRGGSYLFVSKYAPQPGECTALLLEFIDKSSGPPRASGTLSQRQHDVLRWVASGKSNKAIAALLKISPKTVGKHVENVFRKLGVTSRVAAANAYTGYVGESG